MADKTIRVDYLARVEGEGAMHVSITGDQVNDVRLEIFEPPRFFEAFLQGRHFSEVPDLVARICGICPVAYQMSAVHALERALGVTVDGVLRDLRRLLYCGEWIESHVLHITMLHAPDFLGYESAIAMAGDHKEFVERGLRMKKAGNELIRVLGGREIHPINIRVGGFYRVPTRRELRDLLPVMRAARDDAAQTVRWVAQLPFPAFERDYEFVALSHPDEYPMNEGRIVSSAGLDIDAEQYSTHFEEVHVPHSTALHARIRDRGPYLVGPMARFNLNRNKLAPGALALADEVGLAGVCQNPFKSIVIRALEVLHAFEETLRLLEGYHPPPSAAVDAPAQTASGCAVTEAPRGLLYHRYEMDADGILSQVNIVPPTSQNQPTIEADLRQLVQQYIDLPDDKLQHRCEQSIRNYDPCISCATHFLKMDVQRQ